MRTSHASAGRHPTFLSTACGYIVPVSVGGERDEAHGALGQCGNGQAGIDAEIGGHHRAVADVHVFVAEYAVTRIDNTVVEESAITQPPMQCAVPGISNRISGSMLIGESASELREFLRKFVGSRNIGGYLVAAADQEFTEWPEPRALPTHFDLVVQGLHAKQNHELPGPAPWLQHAHRFQRMTAAET